MLLKTVALVFLFIVRLRFPSNYSIAKNVRRRYGDSVLISIRKFEKLDFRIRKALLDLNFLETCSSNDVIPNFLNFKTTNNKLKDSASYEECQKLLLREEILNKRTHLDKLKTEFKAVKKGLHDVMSIFDYLYITSLFLESNIKAIEKIENKQNFKLATLLENKISHDPKHIIYNFSSHNLTKKQEDLLIKGLNFALPPKKLRYEEYLLNFELLYRDLSNCDISNDKLLFAKNELRNLAYSSYKFYNKRDHKFENLTEDEYNSFLELIDLDNVVIQKADKGNVIVLIDKTDYVEKMENILNDTSKFRKIEFEKKFKEVNYLVDKEAEIKELLNMLGKKGVLDAQEVKSLKPHGSQPGILYGLCKVHKVVKGGIPPFRPILSAINTPSYRLAKFFVPILSELTKNEYVLKDSFAFASDIRNQDPDLFMTSFDIDSLFTNLPLDETIELCVRKTFGRKNKFKGLTKIEFKTLLQFATKDALILFNGKYYEQTDGVSMGSPLGPTLANVFLCHWEELWLKKCPTKFKPLYYKRYMDDTFLLFSSEDHYKKFFRYINSRHKNMSFTYEVESDDKLPFLDVLVSRENCSSQLKSFTTNIYRKPTFSGLYTNFHSFLPEKYKTGLILTLLFRIYTLCSDWSKIHTEIINLRNIMLKNNFSGRFIDRCIKLFFEKLFLKKKIVLTVPRKVINITLPFMGKDSLKIRGNLTKLAKTYFPCCKIKVVFNSGKRLGSFFNFKDKVPLNARSLVLYKFTCSSCNSAYVGKTKRHFLVRMFEHLGRSLLTGNKFTYNSKNNNNTAVLDHINCNNCQATMNNFRVIGSARNDYTLCLKESLVIQLYKFNLNKNVKSMPLYLFN